MINYQWKNFIKFYLGDSEIRAHLDALHACPPGADEHTGEIVEGVINRINCSGIIAIVSRRQMDLNRPRNENNKDAVDEYRRTVREILQNTRQLDNNGKLLKSYLHLDIHGMWDTEQNDDIEIGTISGKTCSAGVRQWLVTEMQKHFKQIQIDGRFSGDPSKAVLRWGDQTRDANYPGFGENFNTFQIEISRTLRKKHRNKLIKIFSDLIIQFNEKFV
jgi:hypothetical protein